jgi:hypothetical protein
MLKKDHNVGKNILQHMIETDTPNTDITVGAKMYLLSTYMEKIRPSRLQNRTEKTLI